MSKQGDDCLQPHKKNGPNRDFYEISIYAIITISYMVHEPTSTVRARRLRERRSRGVVMVAIHRKYFSHIFRKLRFHTVWTRNGHYAPP